MGSRSTDCSEASTGVGLGGSGTFATPPAFASRKSEIFIPRKMECKGWVTDYKKCSYQGLTATEVPHFIRDLQEMVPDQFYKYTDWDKTRTEQGSWPTKTFINMWSNETNLATMVGLLEFVKEEIKKVPYKLHWQEVSARLEMSQKRKPLAKAHALFYNGLKDVRRNKSKINVVCRNFRSVSLWEVQWLQNTLLKEKVLREKAGVSNLILLTRSVQILVEPFSRQLSNQADARVAFSDSILTAILTPGS